MRKGLTAAWLLLDFVHGSTVTHHWVLIDKDISDHVLGGRLIQARLGTAAAFRGLLAYRSAGTRALHLD